MALNRIFQRSFVSYTRLAFYRPLRTKYITPSFRLSKRLLSQTSRRQDLGDIDKSQGQDNDKDDARPDYGLKPTFWRMLEAAATAAASITILGYVYTEFIKLPRQLRKSPY